LDASYHSARRRCPFVECLLQLSPSPFCHASKLPKHRIETSLSGNVERERERGKERGWGGKIRRRRRKHEGDVVRRRDAAAAREGPWAQTRLSVSLAVGVLLTYIVFSQQNLGISSPSGIL
jgi:hypothetical protein